MTLDEWAEIMEEPPGGENHGRTRGAEGSWQSLSRDYTAEWEDRLDYVVQGEVHGTRATYNTGCRCAPCKRANREYMRSRRR